ncbi:class I glutamine amidotransferase-like protein [Cubamyces sp. BRFM 1775]|nr:class I glutamine amidotransferase-like protein [Cubamyces sp. BRFM 1775]
MSSSSTSKPYKIAVLLCDTPLPAILASQGDYGAIFEALFRNALREAGGPETEFVVDAYDVRNEMVYPKDVDQYDAVLLTGSAASAYENLDWINKLVDYVRFLSKDKPQIRLIGICFGHQIIARALGGECVPNDGKWEIGVTEIDLTEIGQKLLGVSTLVRDPTTHITSSRAGANLGDILLTAHGIHLLRFCIQNLEQMHRDHVPKVPPNFHLLGSTSVAPNQGMVQLYPGASPESVSPADVHIFTVQGHPEFHKRITEEIVKARHSTGALSDELVGDYQRRADWRNDGPGVVGKTLWEILRASREKQQA